MFVFAFAYDENDPRRLSPISTFTLALPPWPSPTPNVLLLAAFFSLCILGELETNSFGEGCCSEMGLDGETEILLLSWAGECSR